MFELNGYWLSRRPDGRSEAWRRTWYDNALGRTRRVSLGSADLETAKLALSEWVLRRGHMAEADPAAVPLAQVLLRYYDAHGSTVRSHVAIRLNLGKWNEFFGPVTVSQVTPERVREFIRRLRARGQDPSLAWTTSGASASDGSRASPASPVCHEARSLARAA